MKYIIMANTQDIEQDPSGPLYRRSRLSALLIYIVDFYQRRHVNVVAGRVLVLVPCGCLCLSGRRAVGGEVALGQGATLGTTTLSATRVMNA